MADGNGTTIVDTAWATIMKLRGKCAAATDMEDLKAVVEKSEKYTGYALQAGRLLQKDSQVFDKLTKANEYLGKIGEALDKGINVCMDIEAIGKIKDAMDVLDEHLIMTDPDAASAAFGNLFVGFGVLCRHVPILKEWGPFFTSAGDFFTNMENKLIPQKRWKSQFSQIDGWN